MPIGEKLWEEKGKTIGHSIKSVGPEGVRFEQTFVTEVKGFGRFPSGTNEGTIEGVQGLDGGVSGIGQGMCTTVDGDIGTWKVYFFGKIEGGKSRSVNIARMESASGKIAWMKGLVVWMEGVLDLKTMELADTGYEWK
jgi:hypothetical protein